MKILIVGNGWIGNILKDYFEADMCPKYIVDIKDEDLRPYAAVINTAGKTNVDWVEVNKIASLYSNTLAAITLAKMCNRLGKKYVFFSSLCIFESKDEKDIKYEDSPTAPLSFCSQTKVMAERVVTEADPEVMIIRIRLPISDKPHPRNTLSKLCTYPKISTQRESVTVVEDMLPVLKGLIEKNEKGIFHLSNEGYISPADMATALGHTFKPISREELTEMLKETKRVQRVTVYVGSRRIPLLPEINKRIKEIAAEWTNKLTK